MIVQAQITEPKYVVRIRIDEAKLDELAESIKEIGLLQPILVRPMGDFFEVVAGHRRLLATRKIGLDPVPCLIMDAAGHEQSVAEKLHENLYRHDLTPIEEAAVYAEAFEQLLDTDKVAAVVHRSRAVVERRLHLLELDDRVRDALADGKIPLGVAEELDKVKEETKRHYLLDCAISDGATVDKVRQWRQDFEKIELIQEGSPLPGGPGALSESTSTAINYCWLCGSDCDQHELRVKMIHTYCERMWRNAQQQQSPAEADNGSAG